MTKNRDVALDSIKSAFVIGDFVVRPEHHSLVKDGQEQLLEPRAMTILMLLARQAGELVSREALLLEAWPGRVVSDNAINQFITKLRRSLGDDAKEPRYIVTVPKRGYRLIAPVEEVLLEAPRLPQPLTNQPPAPPERATWPGWALALILLLPVLQGVFTTLKRQSGFSHQEPLVKLPGSQQQPRLSADGQYLAFSYREDASPNQLYIQKLAKPHQPPPRPQPLTGQDADRQAPAWSPDGKALAYLWRHGQQCQIRLAALDRQSGRLSGVRALTFCQPADTRSRLAFSRDGKSLYFNRRPKPRAPYQLYQLHLGTGRLTALTHPSEPGDGDLAFALSEDGRQLLVARDHYWQSQSVYLKDLTSGHAVRLLQNTAITALAWGEDNRHYYLARPSGEVSRYALGRLKGEALAVSSVEGLSFAGGKLVVSQGHWQSALLELTAPFNGDQPTLKALQTGRAVPDVAGLDTRQPKATPDLPSGARNIAWSSDGQSLYFASNQQGDWQIWRYQDDDQSMGQVTEHGGFCGRPDSKEHFLYFTRLHKAGLWRQNLKTGTVTSINANIDWQHCESWAITEQAVFYLTPDSHPKLMRFDFSLGLENEVAQLAGAEQTQFAIAKDESRILFTQQSRDKSVISLLRR
ncbi:winged helix-turn-helix domain-containing protein [Gallaecimonas pentaromativorans]|uniref:DNA-binding winged helix-turn-helix (WHTH) protein n=1 Tax=Gallaecimonas pentaromativorans TaxID=584787 RepID=A0A3N1PD94_9GAMM|nr:winged helix-turn-helix domain-containing protein [Gallaecimonas pentaromativorans]ROQ24987.1 DNA-binding winged helix-turn-helix (wHTH) protein [Gallaecimonas pentaromativorans]